MVRPEGGRVPVQLHFALGERSCLIGHEDDNEDDGRVGDTLERERQPSGDHQEKDDRAFELGQEEG